MDNDKFEFQAPQYWEDICPEMETTGERVEDSCFGTVIDKITSECSLKSEGPKYFIKHESGTFMGLKTGEKQSDRRSSVLCERHEDNHSYFIKHVFSNTLNDVLHSPVKPEEVSSPSRKQKQTPHKQGTYLFSVKSKLKTPKKCGNIIRDIIDIIGEDARDLEEKFSSNYGGLGTTKAQNRFTVAQPFSFHQRDEEFLRRKKEKFQKAQEEAVKIPEFHARPVPSYVLSYNMNKLNESLPSGSVKPIKKVSTPGMKVLKAEISKQMRNSVKRQ